jgi:hypothetical protein
MDCKQQKNATWYYQIILEGLTLGQELARLWIELRRSAGQIDEKGGRMFLRASSGEEHCS